MLYRNVSVGIALDHWCRNIDAVDVLLSRLSVLPYVVSLDILMASCETLGSCDLLPDESGILCCPELKRNFTARLDRLETALPALQSVGWTVSIPKALRLDRNSINSHAYIARRLDLFSVLTYNQYLTERMTTFRIWLNAASAKELPRLATRPDLSADAQKREDQLVSQLGSHPFLNRLLRFPNLKRLDLFFWTYMSITKRSFGRGGWSGNGTFTLPVWNREREEIGLLLKVLRRVLDQVQELNFWRALQPRVINNDYERLIFG